MNSPNEPKNPDPTNPIDAAWEDAMTRDFDARVRDLHEAPLDFDSVKGKAHQIRRNRRAAVAGGVLGVAAVITPIAVIVGGNGNNNSQPPPFVETPDTSETTAPDPVATDPDYILNGRWHQADSDVMKLDNDYNYGVVQWGDQLLGARSGLEYGLLLDFIDEDGTVLKTLETTGPPVINDEGTTIAWVDVNGEVVVKWAGGERAIAVVDLAAPGEATAWTAAAIEAGASCNEGEECVVYLNSGLSEESRAVDSDGNNELVASGVAKVNDATGDGVLTVRTQLQEDLDTCGGPFNTIDGTLSWETCDYEVKQISPDGRYIAAPPTQSDGLGPAWIAVLDAQTKAETGRHAPEGGFIGSWVWTTEGNLLFDAYESAAWHLYSMEPGTGEITEIGVPVKGDEFSPFTLIQH